LTYLLPRLIGSGWARHLTLTGERFDARRAEQIGLVTRVVAGADLAQEAFALARTLAGYPPLGLRYIKQGLAVAADTDLQTALVQEADAEVTCFDTDEVRAQPVGIRARQAHLDSALTITIGGSLISGGRPPCRGRALPRERLPRYAKFAAPRRGLIEVRQRFLQF